MASGLSEMALKMAGKRSEKSADKSPAMRRSNSAASCGYCARKASKRWRHAASAAAAPVHRFPGLGHVGSGISKGAAVQPSASRVACTSAAPSAAPCTSCVPALLGEPMPITVLQQIRVGLPLARAPCFLASTSAASIAIGVVSVHIGNHVPAIGLEALGRVVGEPAFDVAVDGDAVVVVKRHQLGQAQGAGERTGFVADAFHQATIAQEGIGEVIDDRCVHLG